MLRFQEYKYGLFCVFLIKLLNKFAEIRICRNEPNKIKINLFTEFVCSSYSNADNGNMFYNDKEMNRYMTSAPMKLVPFRVHEYPSQQRPNRE